MKLILTRIPGIENSRYALLPAHNRICTISFYCNKSYCWSFDSTGVFFRISENCFLHQIFLNGRDPKEDEEGEEESEMKKDVEVKIQNWSAGFESTFPHHVR